MKNTKLNYTFSVYGIVCIFTALTMLFTPFVFANLTDGLVLHHTYDEGQGTIAVDASGNGHDGDISNPEWDSGKFGGALRFGGEGSDAYVTVESTDALNVNECSFMAWINADHWDGTRQIVGKSVHGGCAGRTQYGLFSEAVSSNSVLRRMAAELTSQPIFLQRRSGLTSPLPTMVKPQRSILTLKPLRMAKFPGALNANDDPWRIGQDCERLNYVFAGLIDEVRLWNRALSADEIGGTQGLLTPVDPLAKLTTTWGNIKISR